MLYYSSINRQLINKIQKISTKFPQKYKLRRNNEFFLLFGILVAA
jgi:hypothetical protein